MQKLNQKKDQSDGDYTESDEISPGELESIRNILSLLKVLQHQSHDLNIELSQKMEEIDINEHTMDMGTDQFRKLLTIIEPVERFIHECFLPVYRNLLDFLSKHRNLFDEFTPSKFVHATDQSVYLHGKDSQSTILAAYGEYGKYKIALQIQESNIVINAHRVGINAFITAIGNLQNATKRDLTLPTIYEIFAITSQMGYMLQAIFLGLLRIKCFIHSDIVKDGTYEINIENLLSMLPSDLHREDVRKSKESKTVKVPHEYLSNTCARSFVNDILGSIGTIKPDLYQLEALFIRHAHFPYYRRPGCEKLKARFIVLIAQLIQSIRSCKLISDRVKFHYYSLLAVYRNRWFYNEPDFQNLVHHFLGFISVLNEDEIHISPAIIQTYNELAQYIGYPNLDEKQAIKIIVANSCKCYTTHDLEFIPVHAYLQLEKEGANISLIMTIIEIILDYDKEQTGDRGIKGWFKKMPHTKGRINVSKYFETDNSDRYVHSKRKALRDLLVALLNGWPVEKIIILAVKLLATDKDSKLVKSFALDAKIVDYVSQPNIAAVSFTISKRRKSIPKLTAVTLNKPGQYSKLSQEKQAEALRMCCYVIIMHNLGVFYEDVINGNTLLNHTVHQTIDSRDEGSPQSRKIKIFLDHLRRTVFACQDYQHIQGALRNIASIAKPNSAAKTPGRRTRFKHIFNLLCGEHDTSLLSQHKHAINLLGQPQPPLHQVASPSPMPVSPGRLGIVGEPLGRIGINTDGIKLLIRGFIGYLQNILLLFGKEGKSDRAGIKQYTKKQQLIDHLLNLESALDTQNPDLCFIELSLFVIHLMKYVYMKKNHSKGRSKKYSQFIGSVDLSQFCHNYCNIAKFYELKITSTLQASDDLIICSIKKTFSTNARLFDDEPAASSQGPEGPVAKLSFGSSSEDD